MVSAAGMFVAASLVGIAPVLALSEIKREELPAPALPTAPQPTDENPENTVPIPDPIEPSTAGDTDKTGPTTPAAPPATGRPDRRRRAAARNPV